MSFVPFGGYSNSPLSSVSPFWNELQKHVGAFICYKMALPDYYAEEYKLCLHFSQLYIPHPKHTYCLNLTQCSFSSIFCLHIGRLFHSCVLYYKLVVSVSFTQGSHLSVFKQKKDAYWEWYVLIWLKILPAYYSHNWKLLFSISQEFVG